MLSIYSHLILGKLEQKNLSISILFFICYFLSFANECYLCFISLYFSNAITCLLHLLLIFAPSFPFHFFTLFNLLFAYRIIHISSVALHLSFSHSLFAQLKHVAFFFLPNEIFFLFSNIQLQIHYYEWIHCFVFPKAYFYLPLCICSVLRDSYAASIIQNVNTLNQII